METIDALLSVLRWRDGICVEADGLIYVRRLEGEQWAVGNWDESQKEELFDHPAPAIERFLELVREYDGE